ncbi:MAG: NAD+ synthase [Magnetococcales bacterium]|nr:NAD+ synthase [Magnetococcales bacterium]
MEFTLALAQVNPHVGHLEKNLEMMLDSAAQAKQAGADLIAFPELVLTGYPPEDLLHKPLFIKKIAEMEQRLVQKLGEIGIDAVYGTARNSRNGLYNAAIVVESGKETGMVAKQHLPNFSVFDEVRYFVSGVGSSVVTWRGQRFGVTVCEDIWHSDGPVAELAEAGVPWILNINASPYHQGKLWERHAVVAERVAEVQCPIVYLNMVGGQDELVFDGGSFIMKETVAESIQLPMFEEKIWLVSVNGKTGEMRSLDDLDRPLVHLPERIPVADGVAKAGRLVTIDDPGIERAREIYAALCVGLHDYVQKNGFQGVVLGLSGGVDSALTAVIAADALGSDRVDAVMMPTRYTSPESLEDARDGAERINVRLGNVPIDGLFQLFQDQLADEFKGLEEDVTEENIQPRVRATILMAISNKKGRLLVTTGNKSEVSVGYATLYGDMAGGYSVLKDVLKQMVFTLCRSRNRWAEQRGQVPPLPQRVIDKPPSAELRPDQKDSDSLPPYEVLDTILALYVEQEKGLEEIASMGIDRQLAANVIRLVDLNEYKRRQAPPGVRITGRAFGKDRRYPITNGFRVK